MLSASPRGAALLATTALGLAACAGVSGGGLALLGGAYMTPDASLGGFLSNALDAEFLKEDAKLVSETLLAAVQDAAQQAKTYNDAEMQKVTSAFQMPGMM